MLIGWKKREDEAEKGLEQYGLHKLGPAEAESINKQAPKTSPPMIETAVAAPPPLAPVPPAKQQWPPRMTMSNDRQAIPSPPKLNMTSNTIFCPKCGERLSWCVC